MNSIERKQKEILAYERQFAFKLAGHVLEKPRMNVWMILIPIIIVYHMFRFQKYVDGKKKFTSNYLKTREQALESARGVVAEGDQRREFDHRADPPAAGGTRPLQPPALRAGRPLC
jgi:hypothetical protein